MLKIGLLIVTQVMDLQAPLHDLAATPSIVCLVLPVVMMPGNPRSPSRRNPVSTKDPDPY